jgi:signal transduction histidine kinase
LPSIKNNGQTLGIRKGIPVALVIIFSTALLFQLFLFSYAASLLWRNYTAGFLTLLTESLSSSVNEIFRIEGSEGVVRFTEQITSTYPGFTAKEIEVVTEKRGEHVEGLTESERSALHSGNPISYSKKKRGVILVPIIGRGVEGRIYAFEFDLRGLGDLSRMSVIVGATSFLYILVLFFFTYFVFRKKISSPLSNLLDVVSKIEEGDRDMRVKDMPPNELGRFGDVLNSALDLLEGQRRDLEGIVETLEKTNEELKQSRAQVIRAEKLATIGRLSSGIAHEVGNPLMAIKGYVAHILRNTEVSDEQADCLNRVHDESERIEGILKGLLAHSRISVQKVEEADVIETIGDIIRSLSYRKMCERITIHEEYQTMSKALIDPGKLRQVLLNLFMNGIDAMPESGTLTVRTYLEEIITGGAKLEQVRRRETDPPESNFSKMRKNLGIRKERLEDRFVVVEISDTGSGIKEEDKGKIFDPFFTTKEPGKGTGLGLSVTSAILDSYNGHVSFESEEGKGSMFRVYVPAS